MGKCNLTSSQESQRVLKELNNGESIQKTSLDKCIKEKSRKAKWIRPLVENFKRTKAGNRLIQQEMLKLLADQCRMFPLRSMKDASGDIVRYSANGKNFEIKLSDVLALSES